MSELTRDERIAILEMSWTYEDATEVLASIRELSTRGQWDNVPPILHDLARAMSTHPANGSVISLAKSKIIDVLEKRLQEFEEHSFGVPHK